MGVFRFIGLAAFATWASAAWGQNAPGDRLGNRLGNRLAYLDDPANPYYVGTGFARLTTPQWIGDPKVEAAALLTIDDMNDPARYANFLRPVTNRLVKIDGRAPVTIFTTVIKPDDPRLQVFLKAGLAIETHTTRHPCPLLGGGNLQAAKKTVDDCTDLLAGIPNMKPMAFRMPCCDSQNAVSPRFFSEIFNAATPQGRFLRADSSVFTWFNRNDPALPAELVQDAAGANRFEKYFTKMPGFVNTIENYPFPYVIDRWCWQLPGVVPSDWAAQHHHGVSNPVTIADLKAALDATVTKQGLFAFVFHPHGWVRNTQVVELIDHAVDRHGEKVRFLNIWEAVESITANALAGQELRDAEGNDNGVRMLDLDNDGFMDVVIGNAQLRRTRMWRPAKRAWEDLPLPVRIDDDTQFGVLDPDGRASLVHGASTWQMRDGGWEALPGRVPAGPGRRLRDLDGDGTCELVAGADVFAWKQQRFAKAPYALPDGIRLTDPAVRLADLDADGDLDLVFSDHRRFAVHLFASAESGWSRPGRSAQRGQVNPVHEIPMIARADGSNNGAWFARGHLFFQNEDTGGGRDQVVKIPFSRLIDPVLPKPAVQQPDAGGKLVLEAGQAWIHGAIRLESKYGNLGFWNGQGDFARWQIELPKAGRYQVSIDFACHDNTAGNAFRLEFGKGNVLRGTVPGTGTWDTYQVKEIGQVDLEKGRHQPTFRAGNILQGFLIDLRRIILTPID